jgi:aminopeptidase N
LQAYLNKYKFGNGTPSRLWAELDAASGLSVGKVGDSFVRQTGVPVIYIDSQCNPSTNENVLTITQRALPSENVNSGEQWNIPITLAYGDSFAQTKTFVLDQLSAQFILPSCSAVLANPSGLDYYVSNYSPALWSELLAQVDAIKEKAAKVNIVGDATQLKAAGLISQEQFDQIANIQKPQAAAQILRQRSLPAPAVEETIHKFRYQGVMKHRSE